MRMRVSDYIGNYEHTRAHKQLSLCVRVRVCVYRHIGASHVTKFQVQAGRAASQKNDESKHWLPPLSNATTGQHMRYVYVASDRRHRDYPTENLNQT